MPSAIFETNVSIKSIHPSVLFRSTFDRTCSWYLFVLFYSRTKSQLVPGSRRHYTRTWAEYKQRRFFDKNESRCNKPTSNQLIPFQTHFFANTIGSVCSLVSARIQDVSDFCCLTFMSCRSSRFKQVFLNSYNFNIFRFLGYRGNKFSL